jgi:hypothetical protein
VNSSGVGHQGVDRSDHSLTSDRCTKLFVDIAAARISSVTLGAYKDIHKSPRKVARTTHGWQNLA